MDCEFTIHKIAKLARYRRLIAAPGWALSTQGNGIMVDEVTEQPPGPCGAAAPEHRTLQPEEEPRCRPAVGAAGGHIADNHKS